MEKPDLKLVVKTLQHFGLCPGYEGDASDAEDDTACSATPSHSSCSRFPMLQTALLDFWLILRPELDKVHVFFQTRFVYGVSGFHAG